jgi:hypothetical protein
MLRKTLDRVRKRRQGIGISRLVLYGVVWLLRTLSAGAVDIHYRYVHLQKVRTEPLLKGRARRSNVRTLQGAELMREFERDQVGVFDRPPSDFPRFKRRVERGDICIAVTRSSKTAGVLWLTFGPFDETGVKAVFDVSPSDRMAWASNIFIVDDARGGLMFAELWDGADAVLRERGFRWTADQTSAFNGPALQAHERLGAFRIGRIVYVLLGSAQITVSSLRPHFHVSGPSGKGPVFVIPPPLEEDFDSGRMAQEVRGARRSGIRTGLEDHE